MDEIARRITRRGFLHGTATAAAAGAGMALFGPNLGRLRAASPVVKTLAYDVRHDVDKLAGGALGGLTAASVDGGEAIALRGASAAATYESPVIQSDIPYTHVGLHWLADYPGGSRIDFEARTSVDGEKWSGWRKLHIEAAAGEAARGETYGSLLEENRGRYLQYRARLKRGDEGSPALRYVTATFINTVDGPALDRPAPALEAASDVTAAAPAPPIDFTREEWGADESLRFNGGEVWPRMYVPVKKIFVHHTASENYYSSGASVVRAIYYYHTVTLEWGDIGYNALVDRFGYSYEGRRGRAGSSLDDAGWGREIFSRGVVAGHVSGHNYGSCGIALIGNHEVVAPSASAIWKVSRLAAHVAAYFGVPPHGTDAFKRSDGGWTNGLANLCGHRDAYSTSCPGYYAYAQLGAIRSNIVSLLNHTSGPAVKITDGPSQSVLTGKATYSFTGGSEFSYYLEGWQLNPYSGNLIYRSGYRWDKSPAWSPWTSKKTAEFHHLGKGWYTFHVRSRSSTGKVSVFHDIYKTRITNGFIHLFSDVGGGHWAHGIVEQMYDLGYIKGASVDPPLYRPDKGTSRAELAVFLIRGMREQPKSSPSGTVFGDVSESHWAAGYIERIAELGIVPGWGDYRPDAIASRGGTAAYIARALGEAPIPSPSGALFSDVPASYAHAGYIERLASIGIARAHAGRFRPTDPATRAEMLAFLMRAWSIPRVTRAQMAVYILRAMGEEDNLPSYKGYFADVKPGQWFTPWIERLRQLEIAYGYGGEVYRPDSGATRAEIAVAIVRALGEPPVTPTGTVFSDLSKAHWAAGHIERLAQLDVAHGYADGTFKPNRAAEFREIIAFVSRAWNISWPPQP